MSVTMSLSESIYSVCFYRILLCPTTLPLASCTDQSHSAVFCHGSPAVWGTSHIHIMITGGGVGGRLHHPVVGPGVSVGPEWVSGAR